MPLKPLGTEIMSLLSIYPFLALLGQKDFILRDCVILGFYPILALLRKNDTCLCDLKNFIDATLKNIIVDTNIMSLALINPILPPNSS